MLRDISILLDFIPMILAGSGVTKNVVMSSFNPPQKTVSAFPALRVIMSCPWSLVASLYESLILGVLGNLHVSPIEKNPIPKSSGTPTRFFPAGTSAKNL